jgi:hypothetical protein
MPETTPIAIPIKVDYGRSPSIQTGENASLMGATITAERRDSPAHSASLGLTAMESSARMPSVLFSASGVAAFRPACLSFLVSAAWSHKSSGRPLAEHTNPNVETDRRS